MCDLFSWIFLNKTFVAGAAFHTLHASTPQPTTKCTNVRANTRLIATSFHNDRLAKVYINCNALCAAEIHFISVTFVLWWWWYYTFKAHTHTHTHTPTLTLTQPVFYPYLICKYKSFVVFVVVVVGVACHHQHHCQLAAMICCRALPHHSGTIFKSISLLNISLRLIKWIFGNGPNFTVCAVE